MPSQINFRFTSQPWSLGRAEKRLHAGILGDGGKGLGQESAGGIGDTPEILMRRRDGQFVDERRVQDPKEMKEAVGMEARSKVAAVFSRGQRKGGAEELGVVAFVGCPYPGAVVEVFGEVDQDAREFAKRLGRQPEGIVGEAALRLREHSPKLPHHLGKMRVALPLKSLADDAAS